MKLFKLTALLFFFGSAANAADPLVHPSEVYQLAEGIVQSSMEKTDEFNEALLGTDDALYPHYLVYGFEIGQGTGIGDVFEISGSMGIELHFAREVGE